MDLTLILSIIGIVVPACSAITVLTKTPKPGGVLSKIYKVIEIGALVIGRVKDKGDGVD